METRNIKPRFKNRMASADNRQMMFIFKKLFEGLENLGSFIEWVHFFLKYGLLSRNSKIAKLLFENKKMLKLWTLANVMGIVKNIKQLKTIRRLIKKVEHRTQLILKNNDLSDKNEEQLKRLYVLEKQVAKLKFSYRQASWDLFECILSFFTSIMRVYEIKQKFVDFIERTLQVIELLRISYDIVNFGKTIGGMVELTQRPASKKLA